jgi:hypothetical protein
MTMPLHSLTNVGVSGKTHARVHPSYSSQTAILRFSP